MAASLRFHHLRPGNFTVFNVINFKLLCMPEMREYISILISNRNLHNPVYLSFPGVLTPALCTVAFSRQHFPQNYRRMYHLRRKYIVFSYNMILPKIQEFKS